MLTLRRCLVASALALTACHGAGPYGHSPEYAPLSEEESAAADSHEYDPVMVQRFPDEWRKKSVSLFGVVIARAPGQGGAAYVTLSVRRLEPRNLCDNANDDDSCRVTVSDRDFGSVHAQITLRPDDDVGPHALAPGSLVRVIGRFVDQSDPGDGAPVMRVGYYRHWPRYFYVTRAAAGEMRQ